MATLNNRHGTNTYWVLCDFISDSTAVRAANLANEEGVRLALSSILSTSITELGRFAGVAIVDFGRP